VRPNIWLWVVCLPAGCAACQQSPLLVTPVSPTAYPNGTCVPPRDAVPFERSLPFRAAHPQSTTSVPDTIHSDCRSSSTFSRHEAYTADPLLDALQQQRHAVAAGQFGMCQLQPGGAGRVRPAAAGDSAALHVVAVKVPRNDACAGGRAGFKPVQAVSWEQWAAQAGRGRRARGRQLPTAARSRQPVPQPEVPRPTEGRAAPRRARSCSPSCRCTTPRATVCSLNLSPQLCTTSSCTSRGLPPRK
jgi:hypothetical protein